MKEEQENAATEMLTVQGGFTENLTISDRRQNRKKKPKK